MPVFANANLDQIVRIMEVRRQDVGLQETDEEFGSPVVPNLNNLERIPIDQLVWPYMT